MLTPFRGNRRNVAAHAVASWTTNEAYHGSSDSKAAPPSLDTVVALCVLARRLTSPSQRVGRWRPSAARFTCTMRWRSYKLRTVDQGIKESRASTRIWLIQTMAACGFFYLMAIWFSVARRTFQATAELR